MQRRNWREYNERLVRRGEVYISWISSIAGMMNSQKMNRGKVGRPLVYPQTFIYFSAFIYIVFLPYRQIERFFRKLSEFIPKSKTCGLLHPL